MHDTVKGVTAQQLKGPDRLERVLGLLSLVMLAVILVAILRGMAEWAQIPGIVWLHLATMLTALALTPMLLWRRRGDGRHRVLGYVWSGAMMATAIDSLFIRGKNGEFSVIHLLSAFVIVMVPVTAIPNA